MNAVTGFFVNVLSGAFEAAGESKLEQVLAELQEKHPAEFKAYLPATVALFKLLLPVVEKTATKIDDAVVNALDKVFNAAAVKYGISLPIEKKDATS